MICQTIKTIVRGASYAFPSPTNPVHVHKSDFLEIPFDHAAPLLKNIPCWGREKPHK